MRMHYAFDNELLFFTYITNLIRSKIVLGMHQFIARCSVYRRKITISFSMNDDSDSSSSPPPKKILMDSNTPGKSNSEHGPSNSNGYASNNSLYSKNKTPGGGMLVRCLEIWGLNIIFDYLVIENKVYITV